MAEVSTGVTSPQGGVKHRPADPTFDPLKGVRLLLGEASDDVERRFYEKVLDTFDFAAHAELQAKHLSRDFGRSGLKWLDFAHYLHVRYSYVRELGLDACAPLQIMDIGCGPSHFGFICEHLGHTVIGIDVPGNELFNDLVELLGVPRIAEAVRPATPLPETPRCQYITAFHANFAKQKTGMFTIGDWRFFLQDLINNHMTPKGQIYFLMNDAERARGGLRVSDPEFADFIQANGGRVEKRIIIFDDVSVCPREWLRPADILASGDPAAIADSLRVLVAAGDTADAEELARSGWAMLAQSGDDTHAAEAIRALIVAGRADEAASLAEAAGSAVHPAVTKALVLARSLRAA